MVIFQTSREGSALFSDVEPVPRAVEFKMATGCKFLSLAASGAPYIRHIEFDRVRDWLTLCSPEWPQRGDKTSYITNRFF